MKRGERPVMPGAPPSGGEKREGGGPWMGWMACVLFLASLVTLHLLIGGTRYVFAIPGYALLALAGLVSLFHRPANGRADWLCLGSVLLFGGWLLGRTAVTPFAYIPWFHWMLIPACLLVYLLSVHRLSSQRFRLFTVGILLALAVAHVTLGFVQFAKIENYLPFGFLRPDYKIRASGFFVCPNHYAGFLELCFFMGLSLVCWGRIKLAWRLLAGYAVLVCAAGIVISGSRGSYVSVLGGLAVFAVISLWVLRKSAPHLFWRTTLGTAGVGLLGAVAVGWVLANSLFLNERANDIVDLDNIRVKLWGSALRQAEVMPLTGTGAGTFLLYGRAFRDRSVQHDPVYVHNDYLHLLGEFGWLGVGAFFLCWLAHVRGGFRQIGAIAREQQEEGRGLSNRLALVLGAFCGLAALTSHGVVDFNMHIPGVALVMIWLLGWLGNEPASWRAGSDLRRAGPWQRRISFLITLVCAGWLLGIGAKLFREEALTERVRVLVREERFEEALELAETVPVDSIDNPYFHSHVGDAWNGIAEDLFVASMRPPFVEKAAAAYGRAHLRFPEDVTLSIPYGAQLDSLGFHKEADIIWQRAKEWDPHQLRLLIFYAGHLQHQQRFEEAREVLQEVRAIKRDAYATRALRVIDNQIRDRREGEASANQQNRHNPAQSLEQIPD